MRLKELAQRRVRYGYRRLQILLQGECRRANHKWLYRLYCEEGLSIRLAAQSGGAPAGIDAADPRLKA